MVLGMVVLGPPVGWALGVADSGWTKPQDDAPAAMLLLMAATMSVPMVAWMRRRGHRWQPCLEMTASLVIPTLAAIGLLGAGIVQDIGALLVIEHVAMLAGMFGVMLARLDEYTHDHAVRRRAVA